jgi:hypothetical protein
MPVFEANTSKIKMVILTKTKESNAVWWSPLKQNKRKTEAIVTSMLNRFKKHPLAKITNVVQFYENGQLIAKQRI